MRLIANMRRAERLHDPHIKQLPCLPEGSERPTHSLSQQWAWVPFPVCDNLCKAR